MQWSAGNAAVSLTVARQKPLQPAVGQPLTVQRSPSQASYMAGAVKALFEHGAITTTTERARAVHQVAEGLIRLAKTDPAAGRRRAQQLLEDEDLVEKLLTEIVPRYEDRTSNYIRMLKLGPQSDGSQQVLVEMIDA
ncbi:50S ribosomal protein L17 [Streptomyces sp. 900105755]